MPLKRQFILDLRAAQSVRILYSVQERISANCARAQAIGERALAAEIFRDCDLVSSRIQALMGEQQSIHSIISRITRQA